MRLPDPPRSMPKEPLLPMINVVFLLLIFFLIAARITPPEPFPVTLPQADLATGPRDAPLTLYLSAEGLPGFRGAVGPDALASLAAACLDCACPDCAGSPGPRLTLRADAGAEAAALARLLPQVLALGFSGVDLVTVAP